jgi:prepilin-type N-terminal cleavage/methylation domain-containing protein
MLRRGNTGTVRVSAFEALSSAEGQHLTTQIQSGNGPCIAKIRRSAGFTLVELLVVIGIIALLVSILLPALAAARIYARGVQCESNMRQLYYGYVMYADTFHALVNLDNAGVPSTNPLVPLNSTSVQWPDELLTYVNNDRHVFN